MQRIYLAESIEETIKIGKIVATQLSFGSCVYLQGDMGVGKTTLTKSIIQAFSYQGEVTSPTYNLVQEYTVTGGTIFHMDLYRLEDPSEIEYLALDDLWSDSSLFIVEWPEKGGRYLRPSDYSIEIQRLSPDTPDARRFIFNAY